MDDRDECSARARGRERERERDSGKSVLSSRLDDDDRSNLKNDEIIKSTTIKAMKIVVKLLMK